MAFPPPALPRAPWPPPAARPLPPPGAPANPPPAGPRVETRPRSHPKPSGWTPFRALLASLLAVAVASGAVGVRVAASHGEDESRPSSSIDSSSDDGAPTTVKRPAPAWDERIEPLARFVEEERGRPFKRSVPTTFLAEDDFVDELGVDVEPLSHDDAEYYAAIDRALGWIGPDLDSEAAWTELVETGVAAFYEPGRRRIVIRGERGEGELTVEQRAVLVHELTHAWQDQHFGLDTLVEDTETDLAWMSVVEGHAMHVESRYVATLPQEDQAAWLELEQARRTEHRVAHGDAVMYELALTAPYLLGERLVGAHAARGDTAGVDLLLEEPLYSSEQAMFAAVAAEGLGVTDVDPAVEPDGASWMEERPIGSWDVFTTLVTRLDGRTAVEASRAWAGGWETVYEDDAGDICVSWALAADDDAGRGTLSTALRSWVAAGPAGVAQVSEVEGDIIELAACDPGERAVSPDPVAVYDAVAWLLAHEDVVAGLAGDVPIASADCAATRLLATLEPSDISFDGLGRESGRLLEAAGEFEDACRDVLTVGG